MFVETMSGPQSHNETCEFAMCHAELSSDQNPGSMLYIGHYTAQLYTLYNNFKDDVVNQSV